MAVQLFSGASISVGTPMGGHTQISASIISNSTVIPALDHSAEKYAFCGPVWFAARSGSKSITKVGFRFGPIVKAGGSGLTVSLQDVSTSPGGFGLLQPDETQDQTVAIANGDAGFASNVWYQTGALSATRSVAFGEMVAVVIEFDGGGRLGADTVQVTGLVSLTQQTPNYSAFGRKDSVNGWLGAQALPNVILEFSDGTFGTIQGAFVFSAIGALNYGSGSTPDEYALEFTFPSAVAVDAGGCIQTNPTALENDSAPSLVLYDGTDAIRTARIPCWGISGAGSAGFGFYDHGTFASYVELASGTTYRLSLKPSVANQLSLRYFDVAAAGHLQAHVGGEAWALTSRTDGGAWAAPTTTRRPFLWPCLAGMDFVSGDPCGDDLLEQGEPCADGTLGPLAWIEWQRRIPD